MKLDAYIKGRIAAGDRRKDLIESLAKAAKVSSFTVKNAAAGARIAKYETAKLLSEVCGRDGVGVGPSVVSIAELCEPS